MAVVGSTVSTLADLAQRLDPNGKIDGIVEVMNEVNPIIEDAKFKEGNLPTGLRHTIRTGLPKAYWRLLNQGVPNSKSRTKQLTDSCGMLEVYSEVDKKLADLNGNAASWRLSEDRAFIESMGQEVAAKMFYGDESNPEQFVGLTARYNEAPQETDKEKSSYNIIDAGGTGNSLSSMWLITWGEDTTFGIYPKGSKAGLSVKDLGQHTLKDDQGNQYEGYRSHYSWDVGLVVKDWRYNARIANIDESKLDTFGSGAGTDVAAKLTRLMIIAANRKPSMSKPGSVFYCTRKVKTWLDIMAEEKSNVNLTIETFEGKPVTTFYGYPVKTVDELLSTEAQVK
jgi:hypothetical protein